MKKINIILIVLLSLIGFSSCEDAKDPVINSGAQDGTLTFKLNESQYATSVYQLEDANATKNMEELTCVQPDYGFTAAVVYTPQVCFDSKFEAGKFQSLPTSVSGEKVGVNTKELDIAIIALYGGSLPNPVVKKDVYIRLAANVSSATETPLVKLPTVKTVYSNPIMLKVMPYVLPLFPYTEVTPKTWYIVGLDGLWNNSFAGLGSSLIPLSIVDGKKYNLNGDGEFKYTGYFKASAGFKLIYEVGVWAEQWGNSAVDGINAPHRKLKGENDPNNFKVPSDGFYTITINSIENKATIVPATITPTTYTLIGLIGAFNGWSSDLALTANTSVDKHIWYTTNTFTADSECKLRANGGWDINWGSAGSTDGNPLYSKMGIGVAGGKNFKQTIGTYTVIFNDIDGCYFFIKK